MPIEKHHIDGWLVIDKPYEVGSTQVVSKLKWSLSPAKIGHAGTLDPLATGVLPIALGRATKLIPYVMDGLKTYAFQVTWGSETTTDDREGAVVQTTTMRPTEEAVRAILPSFIGQISQLPPVYSALKVDGKRAYDLARAGKEVALTPRLIRIFSLEMLRFDAVSADFRVVCGKGTYVRSIGRDLGRRLGCLGYITSLRREACGPFALDSATDLSLFSEKRTADGLPILPLETATLHLPALRVGDKEAERLRQGQRLALRDVVSGLSGVSSDLIRENIPVVRLLCAEKLIGLVRLDNGVVRPFRIF